MATDEQLQALLEKMGQVLDRDGVDEIHVFTPEEFDELKRIIILFRNHDVEEVQRVFVFFRRFDALRWWMKWLFYLVVTAGAVLANWERIMSYIRGGGE